MQAIPANICSCHQSAVDMFSSIRLVFVRLRNMDIIRFVATCPVQQIQLTWNLNGCDLSLWLIFITPRACAMGKAIVCRCRHENRQISNSRHVCVLWLPRTGRYRRKTGFCVLRTAEHGSLALQIVHFPFSMPVVYRLHPLHVLTWLDCACSTSM